jgi:uncharacterized protein DUF1573
MLGAAVALAGAGCTATGSGQQPGEARPQAVFPTARLDLGEVRAGEATELSFPVSNHGAAPLALHRVQASCGCLHTEFPRTLAPGSSGEIRTRFEPGADWKGHVQKLLRVYTNDLAQPEAELTLEAEVVPLVRVEPNSALQVPYEPGQVYRLELRLIPRKGTSIVLSSPTSDSPLVKAKLDSPPATDTARGYRLELALGPCPGPGDFIANIHVRTTSPQLPKLRIAVNGLAQTGPVVSPGHITIPSVRAGREGEALRRLRVFTRGKPFRLLKVETDQPGLEPEIVPQDGGCSYMVLLRYSGGWEGRRVTGTLRIRTDDPQFPELPVPYDITVQ